MAEESAVRKEVERLATQLAQPRAMRRASVSARWMKCNRTACGCGEQAEARHGPYYSVTWAQSGQTRSRLVSAEQAALVKEQIEADRQFRKAVEAYRKASERWADIQLADMEEPAASTEAAKKGGSKRPWRRRSAKRSSGS